MEPLTNRASGTGIIVAQQRPRSLCDSKVLSVAHSHYSVHRSPYDVQVHRLSPSTDPPTPNYGRGSWPNNIHHTTEGFSIGYQQKAPSMKALMNTTVPQKLVVRTSGRHHPTRNSLRHSRMVSLSQQQGRGLQVVSFIFIRCLLNAACCAPLTTSRCRQIACSKVAIPRSRCADHQHL